MNKRDYSTLHLDAIYSKETTFLLFIQAFFFRVSLYKPDMKLWRTSAKFGADLKFKMSAIVWEKCLWFHERHI